MPLRVFLSHSSRDKPQVEALAAALHERGIEPWLDKWEIGPGDDIVASINRGLDEADAGIIVFSEHSGESRWDVRIRGEQPSLYNVLYNN